MQYNPVKAGQQIAIKLPDGCEVSIRRPNGEIDKVQNPAGIREMNPALFKRIKDATKAAGRGDVLSFVNKTKPGVYTVTAADAADASSEQIAKIMGE